MSQPLKDDVLLPVASLLTIVLAVFHLADDIRQGMSSPGLFNVPVVLVLGVWLYATLTLVARRSGLIIVLLLSLLVAYVPVLHMSGRSGLAGHASPGSFGAFFFAATLLALGGTGLVTAALAARALWASRGSARA